MAAVLLKNGADPNLRCSVRALAQDKIVSGTALHAAAATDALGILGILFDHGARAGDKAGFNGLENQTALDIGVRSRHRFGLSNEPFKQLLSHGCTVAPDSFGDYESTPFGKYDLGFEHAQSLHKYQPKTLSILLDRGINIVAWSYIGWSYKAWSFKGWSVEDEELAAIPDWGRIQKLELTGSSIGDLKVTDQGLIHLEKCTSLRELYIWGNRVTKAGVDRLRKALPNCQIHDFAK